MFRPLESAKFRDNTQFLSGPPVGVAQLTPVEMNPKTYEYIMYSNPSNTATYKYKKIKQEITGLQRDEKTFEFIFHDDGAVDPNSLCFEIEIENRNQSNYLQLDGTPHSIIKSVKWELNNKIIEEINNYNTLLGFLNDKSYTTGTYYDENLTNGEVGGIISGKEILLHPQIYGTDHVFNPDIIVPEYHKTQVITNGMIDMRPNSVGRFKINIFSYIFNNKSTDKMIPLNIFMDMKLTIKLNDYCFFVPVFNSMVNDLVNASFNNQKYEQYRLLQNDIAGFTRISENLNIQELGLYDSSNIVSFLEFYSNAFVTIDFNTGIDPISMYVCLMTKMYGMSLNIFTDPLAQSNNNKIINNLLTIYKCVKEDSAYLNQLVAAGSSDCDISSANSSSQEYLTKLFHKSFMTGAENIVNVLSKAYSKNLDTLYFDLAYGCANEEKSIGVNDLTIAYEKNNNLAFVCESGILPTFYLKAPIYNGENLTMNNKDKKIVPNFDKKIFEQVNYLNKNQISFDNYFTIFNGLLSKTYEFKFKDYMLIIGKNPTPQQFYTRNGVYRFVQNGTYTNILRNETLNLDLLATIPGVCYLYSFEVKRVADATGIELESYKSIDIVKYMMYLFFTIPNKDYLNSCKKLLYLVTNYPNVSKLLPDVMYLIYNCAIYQKIPTTIIIELFNNFDNIYKQYNIFAVDVANAVLRSSKQISVDIKKKLPKKSLKQSSEEYDILNQSTNKTEIAISREYTVTAFTFTYDVFYEYCGMKNVKASTYEGSTEYYKIIDFRNFDTYPPKRLYLFLHGDYTNIYQLIYNKAYEKYPTYRESNRYSRQMRNYWVDINNKRYPSEQTNSNTSDSNTNFVYEQLGKCMNLSQSCLNKLNTSLDTNTSMYISKKLNGKRSDIVMLSEKANLHSRWSFGYENEIVSKAVFGINMKDIKASICEDLGKITDIEIYMDSNLPVDEFDDFAYYEMYTFAEGMISFKFDANGNQNLGFLEK